MPESKRVCCACRRKVRISNWWKEFPFSLFNAKLSLTSFVPLSHLFFHISNFFKVVWFESSFGDIPYCFADQPKILSAPSSQEVVEGNGAILFCNATGYPEPNITWTKQGNEIVLSTLQVLNLTSLVREDNGAVYTCIVQNYLGTVKASAMVTVFCEYSDFVFDWSNVSSFFFKKIENWLLVARVVWLLICIVRQKKQEAAFWCEQLFNGNLFGHNQMS